MPVLWSPPRRGKPRPPRSGNGAGTETAPLAAGPAGLPAAAREDISRSSPQDRARPARRPAARPGVHRAETSRFRDPASVPPTPPAHSPLTAAGCAVRPAARPAGAGTAGGGGAAPGSCAGCGAAEPPPPLAPSFPGPPAPPAPPRPPPRALTSRRLCRRRPAAAAVPGREAPRRCAALRGHGRNGGGGSPRPRRGQGAGGRTKGGGGGAAAG